MLGQTFGDRSGQPGRLGRLQPDGSHAPLTIPDTDYEEANVFMPAQTEAVAPDVAEQQAARGKMMERPNL